MRLNISDSANSMVKQQINIISWLWPEPACVHGLHFMLAMEALPWDCQAMPHVTAHQLESCDTQCDVILLQCTSTADKNDDLAQAFTFRHPLHAHIHTLLDYSKKWLLRTHRPNQLMLEETVPKHSRHSCCCCYAMASPCAYMLVLVTKFRYNKV